MKCKCWIVFDRNGIDRMAKTESFTLKPGEKAIAVELIVPPEVFAPPKYPTITLNVPADSLTQHFEASLSDEPVGQGPIPPRGPAR